MPTCRSTSKALIGAALFSSVATAALAQSYTVVTPALPPAGQYGGSTFGGGGSTFGGGDSSTFGGGGSTFGGGSSGYEVVIPSLPPAGSHGGAGGYEVVVPSLPPAGSYGGDVRPAPGGGLIDTTRRSPSGSGGSGSVTDPFATDVDPTPAPDVAPQERADDVDLIPISAPEEAVELSIEARRMLETGDAVGALPVAEQARDAAPDAPEMWDTLGAVYAALGRVDEALNAYRFAIRLDAGSGPRVDAYQAALSNAGYLTGPMSGVYDDATDAALEACLSVGCAALSAE